MAAGWNNLAQVYLNEHRYDEARALLMRAAAAWTTALGPDHAYLAPVSTNLANVYIARHKWADARHCLERALEINRKQFGAESLPAARSQADLASFLSTRHLYAEGEQLFASALAIEARVEGGNVEMPRTMANLAANFAQQGRYAEAASLYGRALPDLERQTSRDSTRLLSVMDSYVETLRKLQNYAEAEKLEVRATGLRVKNALLSESAGAVH